MATRLVELQSLSTKLLLIFLHLRSHLCVWLSAWSYRLKCFMIHSRVRKRQTRVYFKLERNSGEFYQIRSFAQDGQMSSLAWCRCDIYIYYIYFRAICGFGYGMLKWMSFALLPAHANPRSHSAGHSAEFKGTFAVSLFEDISPCRLSKKRKSGKTWHGNSYQHVVA